MEANLQDRHGVVFEIIYLPLPRGGGERRRGTPGVVVESKEVSSLIISTAVHVVGGFETVVINICGGVSNWDGAVTTSTNILLHVTRYSLDIRSSCASIDAVDDLVSREE